MRPPASRFAPLPGRLLPFLLLALSACATYSPKPLDTQATAKTSLADLRHETPLPARLTVADIERLVLDNNPDLIAARTQRGLAQAQVRQAGILPNPSFTASYAGVLSGPDTTPAFAAGLSQDLRALITLSSRKHSAEKAAQSVDAAILWQEWQTLGKARLSVVDLIEGEKQLAVLRSTAALWRQRLERNRNALAHGDITLADLAPDVSADADAQKQLDDFERQQRTREGDLGVLLGLAPTVMIRLAESSDLPEIGADKIRAQLSDLPDRRPDLVALQLGYAAQEEKVRGAILAQFPLFSLGYDYARDTANVRTLGPSLTMELPLFDRSQGAIAQERATREQLRAEFTARVVAARSEIEGLLIEQETIRSQLAAKRKLLEALEPAAVSAQRAFDNGDIDERSYVDLIGTRNAKRLDVLALEQTLLEQDVAIATLVGAGMPTIVFAGEHEKHEVAP